MTGPLSGGDPAGESSGGGRLGALPPLREPRRVAALAKDLRALDPGRRLSFMHVCGTHENAVARFGLRSVLPSWLRLIAGPGCPVCVCPPGEIARAARLAGEPGVILATFGDMLRVPAPLSLDEARQRGGDVRVVLSVADAVEMARTEPGREVVFFAVGFETTACTVAAALLADPPANFSILPAHRRIPPALVALVGPDGAAIDGFLLPGHVLTVAGTEEYERVVARSGRPAAVAGFEPVDILAGLRAMARRAIESRPALDNTYPRAVRPEGNPLARRALARAFREADASWRGLGVIPGSGYALREELAERDAAARFGLAPADGEGGGAADGTPGASEPDGCLCGRIMLGRAEPEDCRSFGTTCTPETPVGPCMVSTEGTCRSRYVFGPG